MEKLHQEIFINAPREKVWETMLSRESYREWTKPFSPNSDYQGEWVQGAKMLFVGTDEQGKNLGGMVSRIAEARTPEFVSIEHLGMVDSDGTEDTTSEEVMKWKPSFENYTFVEQDGGTLLVIDIDIPSEYKAMFEDMWPKALAILKDLAEK